MHMALSLHAKEVDHKDLQLMFLTFSSLMLVTSRRHVLVFRT